MIDQIERNEGERVLERARENQKVNSFRRKGQRIERDKGSDTESLQRGVRSVRERGVLGERETER